MTAHIQADFRIARPDVARPIVIVPAHNEGENLRFVIEELRAACPALPLPLTSA